MQSIEINSFEKGRGNSKFQALVNEYKGVLFEFSLAEALCRSSYADADCEVWGDPKDFEKVYFYQQQILENVPQALRMIQQANHLALTHLDSYIRKLTGQGHLSAKRNKRLTKIKQIWWGEAKIPREFAEADLLLFFDNGIQLPVSLKVLKKGGSLNTKSGGVRSFLAKYFPCDEAEVFQQELNQWLDKENRLLRDDLYRFACDDYGVQDNLLRDRINCRDQVHDWKLWNQCGFPEYPSDLQGEGRKRMHRFYHESVYRMYQGMKRVQDSEPVVFKQGMLKLLGFGHDDLVRLILFHEGTGTFRMDSLKLEVFDSVDTQIDLNPPKNGNSYFEMNLVPQAASSEVKDKTSEACDYMTKDMTGEYNCKAETARLRIKPMNTFQAGSFKVNVSRQT